MRFVGVSLIGWPGRLDGAWQAVPVGNVTRYSNRYAMRNSCRASSPTYFEETRAWRLALHLKNRTPSGVALLEMVRFIAPYL
jgi:hypothetical protein